MFDRARVLRGLCGSEAAVISSRRRFHVYPDSFREARVIAGLSVREAALWVGVTPRTVFNWESGHARVPYSAFKLLRILSGYALPGDAWRGWVVRGDTLWSPEQKGFAAADFNWWGLTVAMARAWRQRYGSEGAASDVVSTISLTVADLEHPSSVDSPASAGESAVAGFQPLEAGRGAHASLEGVAIPHCENCGSTDEEGVRRATASVALRRAQRAGL